MTRASTYTLSFLLFFLCVSSPVFGQWSNDPAINNPICAVEGKQAASKIISDGEGGAIIAWSDRRGGTFDVYAQRINSAGAAQWTVNGIAISTAAGNQESGDCIGDDAGGAIIAWSDYRNGVDADIYVQRINANGVVQWEENGVAISTATGYQFAPKIVSDGEGGAIITWYDHLSGVDADIHAQRIDVSGAIMWTANGVSICTEAGYQGSPQITGDGAGGAIITWGYEARPYAQRINSNGVTQWGATGVALSAIFAYQEILITSNGLGGAIITWSDNRNGNSDMYAQCINADGVVQWIANGVAISTAKGEQRFPQIASDGEGGAIIAWENFYVGTTSYDLYAQRIDASGSVRWKANGVAICDADNDQLVTDIVSDGAGGAIIAWHDDRAHGFPGPVVYDNDIYAQRVTATGVFLWAANGAPISTAANNQSSPHLICDGTGGAIITWTDNRSGSTNENNTDIYAQWVSPRGNLGNSSSISGKKYLDADGDCFQDVDESGLPNWLIKLEPGSLYAITDPEGNYSFHSLAPGACTVSEVVKPYWGQTCPQSPGTYIVNLTENQIVVGKDFGNRVVEFVQDLAISVGTSFPRPLQTACCGQEMTYQINYSNIGTTPVSDATLEIHLSTHAQYQETVSSDPLLGPPVAAPGNKLIYILPNPLLPGSSGVVHVTVLLTCPVESAPMIVTHIRIDPTNGDDIQQNNVVHAQDEVSCSYDPNDKSVAPRGCGAEGYITSTDSLTYLIRFQNLGSGPAYHVVIHDTLDSDLDAMSVTTLGSSHPYVLTINGNELVWTFWGITLPPEISDEPGSHGYVRFQVKQLAGNPPGTVIQNRAGIYFDLNPPVITNQTTNTITADPMPVADFVVTPNCVGNDCSYDFTYTGGTAGAIYEWDFGSGAIPSTSTDQNPTGISYSTYSLKVVSLRVILGTCVSEPAIQTFMNPSSAPQFNVRRRWNLVSAPIELADYTKSGVFPTATSGAFAYENGYYEKAILENGIGYWLKFSYAQNIYLNGTPITVDTVGVIEGWNLIGSISVPVSISDIVSLPGGMTTSQFFGYSKGYFETDSIRPGSGYWVKVIQGGKLILSSTSNAQSSLNKIKIALTNELPPSPPEAEITERQSPIPDHYVLEQNYPNPFNPVTVIRYQLPLETWVTLKVYNVLGEEVVTLVNGMQDAGFQSVTWDASAAPSGVYLYMITAGQFIDTKKFILIR